MDKKTVFLTVRIPVTTHQELRAKARRFGGTSEVVRAFIDAFLEDRLVMYPPAQPKKESLYVTRSED